MFIRKVPWVTEFAQASEKSLYLGDCKEYQVLTKY